MPGLSDLRTWNEVDELTHVVLKHPRDAFGDGRTVAAQWQALGFSAPPDPGRAAAEYDHLLGILQGSGAAVSLLPGDDCTTLDSIYVRDAAVSSPAGLVLASMGKRLRAGEPAAFARGIARLGLPVAIVGAIEPPGLLEGGDLLWFDERTAAAGTGYRTNREGLRQLRSLLPEVDIIEVPLPHWRGPGDVMHLMSLISPVSHDRAVVYSPLLPVVFRQWLLDRGFGLIEVDDGEFETMGANVLALSPCRCLMLAGNPRTRSALERAGIEVLEYQGQEISVKGAGGPTCLTRPVGRSGGRR